MDAFVKIDAAGISHRDIKEENILVTRDRATGKGKIKIIDFGLGALVEDSPFSDVAGTKEYYSPEMVRGETYHHEPATVWSLGVLLYSIVCGEEPFPTREEILEHKICFSGKELSSECRSLISMCLEFLPEDRPSLGDIHRHPWVTHRNKTENLKSKRLTGTLKPDRIRRKENDMKQKLLKYHAESL